MFEGHGDDGYKHGRELKADFSTNVFYGGAPAGLKDHLFENWEKVQRYPEVLAESLTKKIAAHYGFPPDGILVTNGSTESIYLVAQAFSKKRTAIVVPAFAEYEDACKLHGHDTRFIPWCDLARDALKDTDLLYICNPNNPTGAIIADFEHFVKRNANVLFVVDEAFIEFTYAITSIVQITQKYSNLIVLRSMTKAYAIPGLRLGYIVGQGGLLNLLRAQKQPWSVNTMAMQAGHFIFDHLDQLQLPLTQLLRDREEFIRGLATTSLRVEPGHTHFFIAQTTKGTGAELKRYLLQNYDLLIRDAGNFRGLDAGAVRIATLSPAKNQLLINALRQWKPI